MRRYCQETESQQMNWITRAVLSCSPALCAGAPSGCHLSTILQYCGVPGNSATFPLCCCAAAVAVCVHDVLQSDTVDAEGNQRIWGTHHRRRDMETMIWRFLTTFRAQDTAADEGMATYTHLLRQVRRWWARNSSMLHALGWEAATNQLGTQLPPTSCLTTSRPPVSDFRVLLVACSRWSSVVCRLAAAKSHWFACLAVSCADDAGWPRIPQH